MIFKNLLDTCGHTPLIRLRKMGAGLGAEVLVKHEARNPAHSVKDRVGIAMLDDAEKRGALVPGGNIVEPTSGNTGIALAFASAVRGYRLALVMPDSMSIERRKLLVQLGAEVILTPGAEGMPGAIAAAERIAAERGAFVPGQFENPANPAAHEATTGPEIWEDTGGRVDVFVSAVGTGGTLTGAARFLKRMNPGLKAVAVEPDESPVISQTLAGEKPVPGPHLIQGIGAGFIPKTLDLSIVDRAVRVPGEEAMEFGRRLAREEGILAGISSGAAVCAALRLAAEPEFEGRRIAVILPDGGDRYVSTELFL